ncbi:MAG: FadR family transcriptional regulator [Hyphomicrobiales bacterium]|nr:MAG: FadR family transcriptional regulator [Hyphomicrobiales bacterium]
MAEKLAEEIFSGGYNPGDMLPKETDLVESLGISRASIRSGLQVLTSLGIIRRLVGQGTVVEEFREWSLLDPTVTRWMVDYANPNPDFLREVFDFRYAIEPYISAIAATRATAQDLAAMEAAYLDMEKALGGDPTDFSLADIAFHTAIYRATHNLIWSQLAHILNPAIMLVIRKSNATADELSDSLGRHRMVMEYIRLRKPEEAYDASISVMDRTAFDLGVQLTEKADELLALVKARSLPARS